MALASGGRLRSDAGVYGMRLGGYDSPWTQRLAIVGAVVVLGGLLWMGIAQKRVEWSARKTARAACAESEPDSVKACTERVDERSADCFFRTYTPSTSSKYGTGRPESLDLPGFIACTTGPASPQEWSAKGSAERRRALEADRNAREGR